MGAQAVRLSNVDIDNALKNKDFEVLFQPVFDLGNGALARVETFVRWRHPKLGLLPPGAFISFFETQGRMSELTRYVLAYALKAYMDWRGPWPPGLSVNLALSDLSDDAFTSHFTKLLRDNDFPPDLVTLECPMPPVDMPIETAQAHFERLSQTGARLAIEVRGRANELLRSLDPFPFDEIKTGGSAILRFARTVRGPGLSAIADLLDVANEANAAITAVGVEDQASLAALRGLGFTAAQGNHLGKVGDLKDFRPHRINEVRALLDLEPLAADSLTALFRTKAPTAQTPKSTEAPQTSDENENALIERLNERVARYDVAAAAPGEPSPDDEKKVKAREKAKALALAKRAKARAERKSAAIERAKAKAAGIPLDDITDIPEETAASQAPREMQERLNRAFTADEGLDAAMEDTLAPDAESETLPEPQAEAPPKSPPETPKEPSPASQGTPILISRSELHGATTFANPQREAPAKQQPAPSLIERAMAAQSAIQKAPEQSQATAGYTAGGMANPISMAFGDAGAYFQPGIHVGAPALLGEPNKPVSPRALNLPPNSPVPQNLAAQADATSPTQPAQPAQATPTDQTAPVGTAAVETQAADTPSSQAEAASVSDPAFAAPAAATEAAPTIDSVATGAELGDLNNDVAENDKASASPRRPKPFLKRTIVPISGYFWPKSWRQAWKRRQAANDAARAEREAAREDTQTGATENVQAAE